MDQLPVAVILINLAFILYSFGLWRSYKYDYINSVILFFISVIGDISGTVIMAYQSERLVLSSHTIIGIIALSLIIMLIIIGIRALKFSSVKLGIKYRQLAVFAYSVWLISFITGIFSH